MKEVPHSYTRKLLRGSKDLAKAYIESIKSDSLPARVLKTTEMAVCLPVLTVMSLPATVVKDVIKPESIYGGLMKRMVDDVKKVYKDDPFPDKVMITIGALAYSVIALTALPFSLVVDTSK